MLYELGMTQEAYDMREAAIGVDIGGTKIHFAVVDSEGCIWHESIVQTDAQRGGAEVLNRMLEGIDNMRQFAETEGGMTLKGIGIGSAGQIDFASGTVAFAGDTLPGWTGMPLKRLSEEKFNLRTVVDNDVNVIAVAEKHFGVARGLSSFVCLALGTGVGGAVMEDGRLIRGAFGGAGELGHVSVNFQGPRCYCGNYGCLELYASGTGIARLAEAQLSRMERTASWEPHSRGVIVAWMNGEPAASQVLETVIHALSAGISSFIHTFNPQAVILGGGVSEAGEPFFEALREQVKLRTYPSMWQTARLVPAGIGVHSGVIGAAAQIWFYK
jgi:glucokinase